MADAKVKYVKKFIQLKVCFFLKMQKIDEEKDFEDVLNFVEYKLN